jgi:hypothetical protein
MSGARAAAAEALVEFLVHQPTAVRRLLVDHIADGRGGCRVCTVGAQRAAHRWPCTIHSAAAAAATRLRLRALQQRAPS